MKDLLKVLEIKVLILVGGGIFRSPFTTRIDLSRPSLVTIGNNVDINKYFQILTHDYSAKVFKYAYHDFLNSSGTVNIGSNIYFGTNVIVLKGVTIGDNCIIAAGSVVSKSIPPNSVAAGVPCRVVCSLDDYYKKRKEQSLKEAVEYVKSIIERFGRDPYPKELHEEFVWFVDNSNYNDYASVMPLDSQLGVAKNDYLDKHKALFKNLEEFIGYCKSN